MQLIFLTSVFYCYFLPSILATFSGTSSSECTQYGNQPAQSSGSMLNFNHMVQVCQNISGHLLTFTDSNIMKHAVHAFLAHRRQKLCLLLFGFNHLLFIQRQYTIRTSQLKHLQPSW